MNVNIPYADLIQPVAGPENPFAERNRLPNQNALAGHVEEQAMSEHSFRVQHLSHAILGYAANPSVDPTAAAFVGDIALAEQNNGRTLDTLRPTHAARKERKRKREARGDLEIVEGEGAYIGPWGKWEGDDVRTDLPEQDELDAAAEEDEAFVAAHGEESEAVRVGRTKPKKGIFGTEKSIFHGKSLTDYQGRSYLYPPYGDEPQLSKEVGSQECFIPKNCIYTWTGHNGAVSTIRLYPNTGHLMLSGGMDTKIKVQSVLGGWPGLITGFSCGKLMETAPACDPTWVIRKP